ncbi:MAG: hypothetical protein RI911_10 [Candidatus Parcubacteria bacterium]|jgi:hypothetical protein
MLETIQNFFKNFDWSASSLLKVSGIALAVLVALSVGLTIFGALLSFGQRTIGMINPTYGVNSMAMRAPAPSMGMMQKVANYAPMGGGAMAEESYGVAADMAMPMPGIMPMPQVNGSRNAELYQREGYSASYETRKFKETCAAVEDLKPLSYVLFDSANNSERYCNYSFRVEKDKTDEIVGKLKALDPKEWNVSVESVAQNIENTTDRTDILKRRLASIEQTLDEADAAFTQLSRLATQNARVTDLTNIISQKLAMVERLTNEKLSLEDQIRMLSGGKDDQIEETTYSHFSVSVSKWNAIDWQSLKDSWKYRVQETLRNISDTLASIVLTIPSLLLTLVWYALVIALLVLFGTLCLKYLVKAVRTIWNW